MDTLYDEDFVLWTERQAESLRLAARQGSNLPLDWENLAEEIESVGKRDRREVESLVLNILVHLVKLAHSPAQRPRRGWLNEVKEARRRLTRILQDSPSLNAKLPEIVAGQQPVAAEDVRDALRKHGEAPGAIRGMLAAITPERVLDPEWQPPEPSGRGAGRAG
jgi:hypothetical protein